MQETIEQKKEYLMQYSRLIRQIARIDDRINELTLNRILPSVNNDGMPHSHNISDLSDYAAEVDELLREQQALRYRKLRLSREVIANIEKMSNEDEKDLLIFRYIKMMKWKDIFENLDKSRKQVDRIHEKALKNFKIFKKM